jgi:D-alanine-D-alanine ligase
MCRKKVGVVCGGFTSEFEISLRSGKTVFQNLNRNFWDVFLITIDRKKWTAIDDQKKKYEVSKGDFKLISQKDSISLDLIFNAIHGAPGENGQLSSLWELLNIPFSSCDSYNAALTYNKRDCLSVIRDWNIPTAKHYAINSDDIIDEKTIESAVGFPCFVKANRAGSSFGVFKVKKREFLSEAIKKAFQEDRQVIIESELVGREVSVGVYALNDSINILPITEIISENEFFDYAAKYEGKSKEVTPAKIPADWKERVEKYAEDIYRKLGLKGVVRSEFIFVNGIPNFLEINSVPGMTSRSIIPQQVKSKGIDLSIFLDQLLDHALKKK